MPIIIPSESADTHFFDRLEKAGASVMTEELASHQIIIPARIGLLNLMPAQVMEETELQWLGLISHTVLQIQPVLMKFDDDLRERRGSSRKPILKRYKPFSEVAEEGLDGLIITGDNQEIRKDGTLQPFSELFYARGLGEVLDWADKNVMSTICSCLAGHFALERYFGLQREIGKEKIFGVYEHAIIHKTPLVEAMDDVITAPHSRWGNISTDKLEQSGIKVVASNEQIGWLLAETKTSVKGLLTFLQGHPEYRRRTLGHEYRRGQQAIPVGYYPGDNPENPPLLTWSNDARALLSNWIGRIYQDYSL